MNHRPFVIALALTATAFTPQTTDHQPLLGFTPESSAKQRELESRFDGLIDRDNLLRVSHGNTFIPFSVGVR